MTVSNGTQLLVVFLSQAKTTAKEPGYYADGHFGVRIENVVIVRDIKTLNNFGQKGYLGFEHITLVCCCICSDLYRGNENYRPVSYTENTSSTRIIHSSRTGMVGCIPRRDVGKGIAFTQ